MKVLQEVKLLIKDGKIDETDKIGKVKSVQDSIADMLIIDTENIVKDTKDGVVKGWIEAKKPTTTRKVTKKES